MELTKFCPRCGRETDRLYGDKKKLCPGCYPEVHDLLDIPDMVEIVVCPVCGRMRQSGEWLEEYTLEEQLAEAFSGFGEEAVEMELQFWEQNDRMFVRVHATQDDMKAEYDSEVRFVQEQCSECSRFKGGFYKVKLQLRGDSDLERVSEVITDRAVEITNQDRKNFLSNIEQNDHGYDFYISTESMAKKILEVLRARYDPEIKRSYELVGEKDGQEVYRNVISVRIE